MAEAYAEKLPIEEGAVEKDMETVNIQARDYEDELDIIVDKFETNLREDKEDVMQAIICEMKELMCN